VLACTQWTDCAASTYVSTAGTAANDRVCTGCMNSYTTTANAMMCTPWSACAPGYQQTTAGTSTSDRVCKKSNGQMCGAISECASGVCANGYCCNKACSGGTESCAYEPGVCRTTGAVQCFSNASLTTSICVSDGVSYYNSGSQSLAVSWEDYGCLSDDIQGSIRSFLTFECALPTEAQQGRVESSMLTLHPSLGTGQIQIHKVSYAALEPLSNLWSTPLLGALGSRTWTSVAPLNFDVGSGITLPPSGQTASRQQFRISKNPETKAGSSTSLVGPTGDPANQRPTLSVTYSIPK
jgi:hypothetical protein